jgi:hypothetical protein
MQQAAAKASLQLAYTATHDRFRNAEPLASGTESPGFYDGSKRFYICESIHIVANYRTVNFLYPYLLSCMQQIFFQYTMSRCTRMKQ